MRRRLALMLSPFVVLVVSLVSLAPAVAHAQGEAEPAESVTVAAPPGAALRAVVGALARAGFVVTAASPAGTVSAERYGSSTVYTLRVVVAPADGPAADTTAARVYFRLVSHFLGRSVGLDNPPVMVPRDDRGARDAWARLDAAKRELAGVRGSSAAREGPH